MIEYRATYSEGGQEIVAVNTKKIKWGWVDALREALARVPAGQELHSVEFWQVKP